MLAPSPPGAAAGFDLLAALALITRAAPEMRLNQMVMFLIVARNEGLLMSQLAQQCGESYSTVSRGIRKLASPGDPGALEPAYGLVELLSDAADRRARHIVLTDKGRALDRRLSDALAGRG